MMNNKVKLVPEEIVASVLEEAESSVGTWSFAFIKQLQNNLKHFDQKRLDKFVCLVLNAADKEDCSTTTKFKIAQLLSTLRSFFLPGIILSLHNQNKQVAHIAEKIQQGNFCECTKKMYLNLLQTNVVQSASHKIKSNSVGPTIRIGVTAQFDSTPAFSI